MFLPRNLWKSRKFFYSVMALNIFFIFDLFYDYVSEASTDHLVTDQMFVLILTIVVALGLPKFFKKMEKIEYDYDQVKGRLRFSSNEIDKFKMGINEQIEKQRITWKLTSVESDILILLVKGLSFKEISELRKTKEQTVRQQAQKIYKKSGLTGRKELAAYFLEDLLPGN